MRVSLVVVSTALLMGCAAAPGPSSETGPGVAATAPPGEVAIVTRLFDGDSMEVEIDGRPDEVRLLGINAPEGDECYGETARETLAELIGRNAVTLVAAGEDRDGFGRMLRYLFVGDRDVNAEMVAEGHATVLQGDHPRNQEFALLSDRAWEDRLGMWSPGTCGGGPESDAIEIGEIRHDPPGPDDEVLTDEWIEIENRGADGVDLGGWILRDESSQNRFRLPAVSLSPGDRLRVRTGCGPDSPSDLHWCSERSVWSNGGDTVILQDPNGNVVTRERYP